ncbi:MAG: EthD family reductase [Hyphomicrobiaceae bacterium]|nr:EthD family reductase [Hyphomicrobiaceae bacterium]
MHKIALLYKRSPGLSVSDYQSRWRTDHARRMAEVPGVLKYVQSHPLMQGYTKGELLFDGIEELWLADEAATARAVASNAWQAAADASRGFLDTGRTVLLPLELHVIKDGAIPENAVKNIEFVNQRPGMDFVEFRRYWREVHGPLASRILSICRYEQNHTSIGAYRDGVRPAYDGLAITWFASTADMKTGARTPEYAETRADEPAFLPDGHLPIIITREHRIVG